MSSELEPLRFAAGQGRHRLAEPQVLQADVDQGFQFPRYEFITLEKRNGFGNREIQYIGDRLAADLHFEDLGPVAPAVAVGAAQVDVGEKLHLDVLEAVAAAGRAAAV